MFGKTGIRGQEYGKKIMRDPLFLAQKSTDATEADRQVITDLLDTLRANLDHCVGMAANMIGVKKISLWWQQVHFNLLW